MKQEKFELIEINQNEDLEKFLFRLNMKHKIASLRVMSNPESMMGTKKQFLCRHPQKDTTLRLIGPGFIIDEIYKKILGLNSIEITKIQSEYKKQENFGGMKSL